MTRKQTEEDFAQIAGAGLNFVRIPLPYWAIETRANEPFLPKTAWTYVFDDHQRYVSSTYMP
jgi:aryl-phospho-beta-D-glucosidase BglC (GH1 family)